MYKTPVYFVGIGGIGMSGVAQYFLAQGHAVAGYDRTLTPLTKKLVAMGATVTDSEDISAIPKLFTDAAQTKIIYTPAIPSDSPLLNFFQTGGFRLQKRAEIIGEISATMPCLAVAGTHGKTTTTSLLTHLLRASGKKITSFLGGIAENIGSNFLLEGQDVMVVEADEFDRSFMYLFPTAIALTSMDADHLDIYGTSDELTKTFSEFAAKVSPEKRFIRNGLAVEGNSFGMDVGTHRVVNLRTKEGCYIFDFQTPKTTITNLKLPYPGKHNLMNAAAALALALEVGCDAKTLRNGLATFKGVDRRFSLRMTSPKILIDDYAHHPTEINAIVDALESFYPNKRKLGVFQPHLFSRTRDFAGGFKKALTRFDEVLLLDIYPARELPLKGISSQMLMDESHCNTALISKASLAQKVTNSTSEVVAIMGAGDIAFEVPNIIQTLMNQHHE
ncbi:MAG: UDP-N-acetylmuramate--L-alanine ligase [Bacteroidota bacterium]|nr:MAG: UDP-N-acetylmuramate--L-alanine ligase [Bacteroidota bacterium]